MKRLILPEKRIVASHQPNFLPYMGFFYKMYMADVFTLSDTVQYSNSGFHNYNYVKENGSKVKITVPVKKHKDTLDNVMLEQWEYHRKKIWKRIRNDYAKAPYVDFMVSTLEKTFDKGYITLVDLNKELIKAIKGSLSIETPLILESELKIEGNTATEQILDICRKTECNVYLSGTGATEYLDTGFLQDNGVTTLWSAYEPIYNGELEFLSVVDYLANHGPKIPTQWIIDKERLQDGRIKL